MYIYIYIHTHPNKKKSSSQHRKRRHGPSQVWFIFADNFQMPKVHWLCLTPPAHLAFFFFSSFLCCILAGLASQDYMVLCWEHGMLVLISARATLQFGGHSLECFEDLGELWSLHPLLVLLFQPLIFLKLLRFPLLLSLQTLMSDTTAFLCYLFTTITYPYCSALEGWTVMPLSFPFHSGQLTQC